MADEKLNVSPEENPQPSLFDAGLEGTPAQDVPALEPPAPENTPEQVALKKAATKNKVKPEQPPTLAREDTAAEDKGPDKKGKTAEEKKTAPEGKSKGRRGHKPKEEKVGPGKPGGTGARRGRPPKADKAAHDKPPSPHRDKMNCPRRVDSEIRCKIF